MKKKITFNLSTQRECMWVNAFGNCAFSLRGITRQIMASAAPC